MKKLTSLRQLAFKIGYDPSLLSAFMRGERTLPIDAYNKIKKDLPHHKIKVLKRICVKS